MTQFEIIMLGLDGLEKLTTLVVGLISKAKQDAELTPEQEQVVYARQRSLVATADHWKIDPDPTTPVEPS